MIFGKYRTNQLISFSLSLVVWKYVVSNDPSWQFQTDKLLSILSPDDSYCNSVLQALYYCKPFRECVNNFPQPLPPPTPLTTAPGSPLAAGSATSYFPSTPTVPTTPSIVSPTFGGNKHINGNGTPPPNKESTRTNLPSRGGPPPGHQLNSNNLVSDKDNASIISVPGMDETLFACLKDLFWKISTHKKKSGIVAPVQFMNKVKKENELFRSSMHQDAHEFLNFVLNTIAEDVSSYQKKNGSTQKPKSAKSSSSYASEHEGEENGRLNGDTGSEDSSVHTNGSQPATWVHQLFEGVFSNETRCLTCETVTSRDEAFMDLSIDVEMNSSITSCLRQFSASETLCHKNKYFCDVCSGLQEAERRMKIKKLPNILALHLKRFKYQEQLQKYTKLTYRVVFPFELRLFNTCDDTEDPDRFGPHHGHYVTIIKSNGKWMLFDDDIVTSINEDDIQRYFGDLPGTGSGYVLFYQAVDFNMDAVGMPPAANNLGQGFQQQQAQMNEQSGAFDLKMNFHEKAETNGKYDMPKGGIFIARDDTPSSTDSSVHGLPVVLEERKSRWGLRKNRKDSTKEKR
ncbi:hypothetical protein INT43_001701 [Umbelopsis isabellina]|uniref:ubiquitinyl hydrolase 1 n=1 Tax=Mortierella isabellina TaxID=91625 RepID=A0A8H7PS07_MORIS|nr:hypothetical protein INT43_001701 [Umbelopsis isabellina]